MRSLLSIASILLCVNALAADMRIPAWASAPGGDSNDRLFAKDIQGWIGDEQAEVRSVRRPGQPLVLLLVMDLVGSLGSIEQAKSTLTKRIAEMGPEWHVAILKAPDGLSVIEDPSQDLEKLQQIIQDMPVSAYPGLLDSVVETADIAHSMLQNSNVRVAVLYVTDGDIDQYRGGYDAPVVNPSDRGDLSRRFRDQIVQEKVSSTADKLAPLSAPLFFVHLNERSDTLNVAYQNGIRAFAAKTAGEAFFARGQADIPVLLNRALDRIAKVYAVTLRPPGEVEGPLSIRLDAGDKAAMVCRPGITIERKKD